MGNRINAIWSIRAAGLLCQHLTRSRIWTVLGIMLTDHLLDYQRDHFAHVQLHLDRMISVAHLAFARLNFFSCLSCVSWLNFPRDDSIPRFAAARSRTRKVQGRPHGHRHVFRVRRADAVRLARTISRCSPPRKSTPNPSFTNCSGFCAATRTSNISTSTA